MILLLFLILLLCIMFKIKDKFDGGRDFYTPPKYLDLCQPPNSSLYGIGENTKPNYSSDNGRTYWDTSNLWMIHKNLDGTYERKCDKPSECFLSSKINNKDLVYNHFNVVNNLENSAGPSSLINTYSQYGVLIGQPMKYNSIRDRYSPEESFSKGVYSDRATKNDHQTWTGKNGYIVTEEECMASCKEDCLGYFMIPNQFGKQPYCLHLGIGPDAKDKKIFSLYYSCVESPPATLNNVTDEKIYGRIKDNNSPLLLQSGIKLNAINYDD